jgi:hypothetical protein
MNILSFSMWILLRKGSNLLQDLFIINRMPNLFDSQQPIPIIPDAQLSDNLQYKIHLEV